MAAHLLSSTECDALLAQRPQWSLQQGKLHRDLKFADFSEAFGFMARVALLAEAMGHHPEWSNVCLLYTSPSPRDVEESRMPSSA